MRKFSKPKRDATGMLLLRRDAEGRFVYQVMGSAWNVHEIALTHEQRVRFASLRRLVERVRPKTTLYPANLRSCGGRGSIGETSVEFSRAYVWLPVDARLSEETCRVIAHEFVHNDGLRHAAGCRGFRAPAWIAREAYWIVQISKATNGYRDFPEVKGLRKPPTRKPKVEPTKGERATLRRLKAEERNRELLVLWEKKLRLAQTKVRKYRRSVSAYDRSNSKKTLAIAAAPKPEEVQP